MEPQVNHKELFLGSGCLSADGLHLYVGGQLNKADLKLAEMHLEDCKFCASAVSGTFEYRKSKSEQELTQTHARLSEDVSQLIAKKKNQLNGVEKNKRSPIALWVSIAASVLLLVGLFFAFQQIGNDADEQELAVMTPKPDSPIAGNVADPKQESPPAQPSSVNEIASAEQKTATSLNKEKPGKEEAISAEPPSTKTLDQNAKKTPFLENAKPENNATPEKDEIVDIAQYKETQVEPSAREVVVKGETKAKKSTSGKILEEESNTVFTFVEEMPSFPGGESARLKYLQDNVNFPQEARESSVAGTVFLSFVVDANGRISNVRVVKGIDKGCDAEAVRVVKKMPRWIPGKQAGKPVSVNFTMPIKFNSR
jgi:protein TonB